MIEIIIFHYIKGYQKVEGKTRVFGEGQRREQKKYQHLRKENLELTKSNKMYNITKNRNELSRDKIKITLYFITIIQEY